MTNLRVAAALLGLAIAPQGWAQAPAFEVASIKADKSGDGRTRITMMPGGRFSAENATVKTLLTMAYGIKDSQISAAPAWMESEHYDIVAKPEGAADQDHIKLMIQALLADRFKLKFHRETKEMPIYALVVDKGGSKLKESAASIHGAVAENSKGPGMGGRGMRIGRGQMTVETAPLSMLANQLSNIVGKPVIDKTGLTGDYDFELKWTPDEGQGMKMMGDNREAPPPTPSDSGPSIFTALQEQLGLKLEPQKGPVEIFAIDHVEKPSEN